MRQTFQIEGMHCGGCVARVTKALKTIADDVEVTLNPPQARIEAATALSLDEVRAVVSRAGDFRVSPVG
jgi:copper chaperone CopZ